MNFPFRKLIQVCILLLVIWLGYSFLFDNNGYFRQKELQKTIALANQQIENLKHRNLQLRDSIYRLQNDTATIERLARTKLGMSKPGEQIFKFKVTRDAHSANSAFIKN